MSYYTDHKEQVLNRIKSYYRKNKQAVLDYKIKYYRENKGHILAQDKVRRQKNHDKILKYARQYYSRNREKCLEYNRTHRLKINTRDRLREKECVDTWRGFIPHEILCPCCGRKIFFASGVSKNSIHFDHRHEGVEVIKSPSRWLTFHKRTPANEIIWNSCNFGMLCKSCNGYLPTKNRKQFVRNVIAYIGGV